MGGWSSNGLGIGHGGFHTPKGSAQVGTWLTANQDCISVPHSSGIQFSNDFGVSFWFKPSSIVGTPNDYILDKQPNRWAIIFGFVAATIEFFSVGHTGDNPRTGSQILLSDTEWHHIIYNYDGATWAGYLDGSSVFSMSATFTLDTTLNNPLFVGCTGGTASFISAQMGSFIARDSSFSAAEIAALAADGSITGATLDMPVDDGSGTDINNNAGSNGTLSTTDVDAFWANRR